MEVMKNFKISKTVSVFTVLVWLACLLFYFSSNPVDNIVKTQDRLEREELGRLLKNAPMDDRTIILTTLNKEWAEPGSMLDLFLESFRIGIEKKVPDLKSILNDWKNFTALSPQEKEAKGSSTAYPWSAPNKCRATMITFNF
ncbi:hypothetical protein IFM89_010097 [Coptis chinensis]|uniref:Uncharacterized protein n=1 Tax=Coptis chinensis TaxID=261450 RepID=A0A835I1Z5_9MAGN|nr:hypothetical protein IFM89_010097 [Coptis chinensis]